MTLNHEQQLFFDRVTSLDFDKMLLLGEAGSGKAQPLYSRVLTPHGWTTMGEIKEGDEVVTPSGGTAKVVKVFPQGEKEIYEITTHDGAKTHACGDHLWRAWVPVNKWNRHKKGEYKIVDTRFIGQFLKEKKLRKSQNNISIQVIDRRNTPDIGLPLNPYILGCLLGDGGLSSTRGSIMFTSADQEIIDKLNGLLQPDFEIKKRNGTAKGYEHSIVKSKSNRTKLNGIKASLGALGVMGKLSFEKEIPEIYMNSGTNQKIELLRGLFDTDGTATGSCSVSFSSSSKKLAEQVQEIVWSLGGMATITTKTPTYTHKGEKRIGRINYRVWVRTKNPSEFFSLTRKISRCPKGTDVDQFRRRIKSVEFVGRHEARCIMIDDPEHLYVTDGYIVTHNTFVMAKAVSDLVRRGTPNVAVCAPTHLARLNLLKKMDGDVQPYIETMTVASLLLKFGVQAEDGSTQFTAGKKDKVDKYTLIVLDECSMISATDYDLLMSSKAKIIYLGDYKQLPPVMAKSAEGSMDKDAEVGSLEVFTLVQQMRQQGVIHAAAQRNRHKPWFPEVSESGEGGEKIIVHDTRQSLITTMVSGILSDARGYDATHHHRFITYKNVDARDIGKRIRDKVLEHHFGFDASSIPFIFRELIMMRENRGNIGYNGELVEIQTIKRDTKHNSYPWDSYELMVKGSLGTGLIRTIPPCQMPRMTEHIESLQTVLRVHQINNRLDDAERVLQEIKRIKSYWTVVQNPYAVTTHKSQGSTIENVYLDTLSFSKAPSKRALLYVGISRASQELHTIRVPNSLQLQTKEVNQRYRKARAQYQEVTGQPYTKVLQYLNVSTRSLEGKDIVAGYLESLVEDLKQ